VSTACGGLPDVLNFSNGRICYCEVGDRGYNGLQLLRHGHERRTQATLLRLCDKAFEKGMIGIVRALWPGTIAVLCFTPLSAAAFDPTKTATQVFAPQINLATPLSLIGKSPVRKRRLRETAPQLNTKRGCPITAESHYIFC
jgi:hypothetical protein